MASYFCTFRSTRSPPRKRAALPDPSDVSTNQVPFRSANPEQLQEVTLGTQLEYPEGGAPAFLRSSAGCHSPIRTRTMKEYDQQIAELKKENFSLKLRIYFLEERWEHKFPNSTEEAFQANIELKVEVESLKKELTDKQELLVKASNALEAVEAANKAEIEDLRQQFAHQRLALEQQIFQFQQAVTGFHNEKSEQSNSDDGNQTDNFEQAASSYVESLPNHLPLIEELNAKVFRLESQVEQLNKDLTQSQATVKDLEKVLAEKEANIKQEDINNIKRNKLIQGLVETVKTKEKQLVQIQEKLDLQESELKTVKSELNEKIKLLQEKPTSSGSFASLPSNNRVTDLEAQPNNDALEDLRKEKERLEAAWRDAVRQRDETIQDIQDRMQLERHKSSEKIEALELHYQTLQSDLHQQLQFKEEQISRLKQTLQDRETVIADCLQLVGGIGLDDLEAAKDLSVHSLSQKLKLKIKEKEHSVQAVLEDKLKLLKEKDNELTQLRESLQEKDHSQNEKFIELKEAQEVIFKLQSELQERDAKIQELMDTIQNLYKQIEEIHESNARTIAEKDTVVQRLQKSLVSTEEKLEDFENNSMSLPDQQHDRLLKLQMSLDEKENTIKTLLTDMAEKDKELQKVNSSVSSSNIQELEKETLKLKGEIVSLHAKLQGKEGFLVYLKEYLENLLNESVNPVKGLKEATSRLTGDAHAVGVPDTSYLEQKLADLKARLKDSHIRNQQLEAQLASVNNRLAAVTPRRTDKREDESNIMCGGGDNSILTNKDQSPRNPSQINTATALGDSYSEVFVSDAPTKEISQLKKGSPLSKSQPVLLDRRLGKSNIPVRLKAGSQPSKGSNHNNYFAQYQAANAEVQALTTKLASTENTVHMLGTKLKYYRKLLQEAGIAPLASPGSQSMSSLLPASTSERRLSFLNSSFPPKMINPSRRSMSVEDLYFGTSLSGALANSNQALSAEDVLTSHVVKTTSEKKFMSEKVTEEKSRSSEKVQLRIKIPAQPENASGSCQTISPVATDEKCLTSERTPADILKRTGMEIPLTPTVIDLKKENYYDGLISSPYTPDSVVDYGQSNDTLELKEQVCRLKLQLDQRDAELQFLRCKHRKDSPLPAKEKSNSSKSMIRQCFNCVGEDADISQNSPFILQEQLLPPSAHDTPDGLLGDKLKVTTIDAACQVEETVPCRQSNDHDLLDALAEIEHLQGKNESLNSKLESLIEGIPEGKLKSFIELQQQEATSLKNRLLESHNACEMLRSRLEELADFLEHLLQFDENGLLDTSQLTPQRIASLHRCIAQSRELSMSLSHSLLVDADMSMFSNFDKTHDQTSITLPFPECTLTSDDDQHILHDLSKMHIRTSKHLESSTYSALDKSHRKSYPNISALSSQSLQDLMDESNVSMEMSSSHNKKLQKENCEKNKLIAKLRNQVKLLQEQIRQRDIEHAWNNLDNTLTETSQASYPTTNDHQSAKSKKRTSSGHKQKLLHQTKDIIPLSQSLSNIEGKPCPAVPADREFVWQSQLQTDSFDTNTQHRSAPHTPANHSSCDDLILLLQAERDVPSRQSGAPSHHSQEQSTGTGHLADELANCEMRTLEALQEQAIMAEYVRHYTTRQFLDEDIHHRVPPHQQPSALDLPEKEKPQKLRSRHIPSPTDSDSWSEPDRDVSQQRMGIEPEEHSTAVVVDRWRSPRSSKNQSNARTPKTNSSSEDLSQFTGSRAYRTSASPGAVSTSQTEQKEIRRLQARLQSLEELNSTLRSELQLYETLDTSDAKKSFLKTQECCSGIGTPSSLVKDKPVRRKSTGSASQTQAILQEHLMEIRILRSHLEESIKTNEHLREKMEQKLSLQQEYMRSGKSVELDKLYEILQQKEQEISDLQEQLEYYRKLAYTSRKTEQEKTARQQQQQQQINELKEHIQNRQQQMEQLQKELSDREQASSELKQAMQRLQGSTVHLQTALNDKELVNRELREANSRMQRTLDTVDQLMSQREKEMQNVLSQRDKLKGSMQELLKKQEAEVGHLNKKLVSKDKDLMEQKKALDDLSELNIKLQRHSDKSQEEILHLHKSLANKEDILNREMKRAEALQAELSKKAQELQISQKKCDDLMVALSETEHLLEQEHGLSLTLQQKVNALNMAITEKENACATLHQRIHDLDNQLHNERININEVKKSVEESKLKYKESQCQVSYLQGLVEKLKVTNAERKREHELQLEKVQIMEKQLKEVSISAKDYEQKFQKERSVVAKLQEQNELLKKQSSNLEMEANTQRITCEQLRQQLHEQEKIYFDLQAKLDERSATIRKLEEEMNHTMEENFMLHQEVVSHQSKLKEATELNKSMKTELNVYEHLHASIISQRNASNPDKAVDPEKKLHLEELLEEIRNLRGQLELSIQTNNALRSQLEEQFKAELKAFSSIKFPQESKEISQLISTNGNKDDTTKTAPSPLRNAQRFDQATDINSALQTHLMELSHSIQTSRPVSRNSDKTKAANNASLLPWNDSEVTESNDRNKNERDSLKKERSQSSQQQLRQCSQSSDYISDPTTEEFLVAASDTSQKITAGSLTLLPETTCIDREILAPGSSPHSMYSSPDLGIESDPNHFSSLERKHSQALREIKQTSFKSSKNIPAVGLSYSVQGPFQPSDDPKMWIDSDRRLLFAIGRLDDYELLKREVEEGIIVLKGIQARIKERIKCCPSSSPLKNMEIITLKEIQNGSNNLQICLGKSSRVIGHFWTAMLPSSIEENDENHKLIEENRDLKRKLQHQKKTLNDALQKLTATNRLKAGMEKAIAKQLTKTHDVLRKARGNLTDQTNLNGEQQ